MRNVIPVLLLGLVLPLGGCGKTSRAAAKTAPGRPAPPAAAQGPPEVSEVPQVSTATSVPDASVNELDVVDVQVEVVERDSAQIGGAVEPGYDSISVRVKVTSRQETPRLLIEPRRFRLQADGREVAPRPTAKREPILRSTYLQAGQSVRGWLTFEPPREAGKLVLQSDLRRPPIAITLPAPGGSKED